MIQGRGGKKACKEQDLGFIGSRVRTLRVPSP